MMSETSRIQTGRSDDDLLRSRIAAIIDREVDGFWEPLDVADAVITELGADYFVIPKSSTTPLREFMSELGIDDDE